MGADCEESVTTLLNRRGNGYWLCAVMMDSQEDGWEDGKRRLRLGIIGRLTPAIIKVGYAAHRLA